MNRIRKFNNVYQVIVTPNIHVSPDSALMVGNWEDENLRNYKVLTFEILNDALAEAYKYADIDWHRLVINHEHIFYRLVDQVQNTIDRLGFNVQIKSNLMDPITLKNIMFDRVLNAGDRFNMRYGLNDIINITITNPWSNVLHKISKAIELHREWIHRDDFRIRYKKIIDGVIICLYGVTEFGTTYEIKLMPTTFWQWSEWMKNYGHIHPQKGQQLYQTYLKQQKLIDKGPVLV